MNEFVTLLLAILVFILILAMFFLGVFLLLVLVSMIWIIFQMFLGECLKTFGSIVKEAYKSVKDFMRSIFIPRWIKANPMLGRKSEFYQDELDNRDYHSKYLYWSHSEYSQPNEIFIKKEEKDEP